MKLITTILLSILSLAAFAQQNTYDSTLAKTLGADDYGMRSYVFVMLKTGSNTTAPKAVVDSLFRGHMNNMERLVKENKLIVAGPMQKNPKSYRGIFILNAKMEEAEAILATDPAIHGQLLEAEVYGWYGSAALPMYLQYAEKISKKKP